MNFNYDPKTDSLYLEFRTGTYDRSKKVSDGVVVDYDKKGKALGIEVLMAKKTIKSFVPGKTKMTWNMPFAGV